MSLLTRLPRLSTLALPAGILALIVLMIVPVLATLLDVSFVLNIALSAAILMAAMNAQKPLDFSSFPSVLLFATLLRLALNVASTRVVLVHGHEGEAAAGYVIEAFGAFLIGGNFAVGLFVFMILVIINLVVVTKGAGRVSEVSARFTLDALPGKQMAIDADLAAGLMTADEAKARRREVATEADFYGSMDGASKFVKGDAIAALLILGVNIIAGFCLGMLSHGLSAGEAAKTYITLAVGDALVAQVPALLLSIAAAGRNTVCGIAGMQPIAPRISGVRKQLSQAFGFVVPQFRVRDALDLPPDSYRILLGGVPLGGASVRADRILAINAGEARDGHRLEGEETRDPSFGCPAVWIDAGARDHAIAEGFLTVDASTVIATHLNQLLAERAQDLLGPDEVKALLEAVKEHSAGLVETIYPQPLSLAALTRLLRALLEDGIPISHPMPILTGLSQGVQQTQEHERLVELLRADLGALIVGRVCAPDERLPVVTLDAALEASIVQGLHDPTTGQPVIEPDLARTIGEHIAALIAERGPGATPLALVVQPRARRALAALLKLRAPSCLVLSIAELPPAQPIEVIDVIGGQPAQPQGLPQPEYSETHESMAA